MPEFFPIITAVLGTAWAGYCYRSPFAPAVWYQLSWTTFTLVSYLVAGVFFEPPDPSGLWIVLLFNLFFFMGCFMTSSLHCHQLGCGRLRPSGFEISMPEREFGYHDHLLVMADGYRISEQHVCAITIILVLLSVLGIFLQLADAGVSLLDTSIAEVQVTLTQLRYEEQFTGSIYARVLFYGSYMASFLSGLMFPVLRGWRRKMIYVLPLVVLTLKAILFTTRFGTLVSFMLFFSGYLSTRIYLSGGGVKARPYLYSLTVGFVSLLLLSFVVQLSRAGHSYLETADDISKTMSLLSPLIGFLTWYKTCDLNETLTWGARTFEGLYELAGVTPRTFGQYTDTVGLSGLETANVYTVYRGLIEDFSLAGAAVICLVLGMVVQYVYICTLMGGIRLIPVLAAFYVFTFISFANSIFFHNSLTFSLVVITLLWLAIVERAEPSTDSAGRCRTCA